MEKVNSEACPLLPLKHQRRPERRMPSSVQLQSMLPDPRVHSEKQHYDAVHIATNSAFTSLIHCMFEVYIPAVLILQCCKCPCQRRFQYFVSDEHTLDPFVVQNESYVTPHVEHFCCINASLIVPCLRCTSIDTSTLRQEYMYWHDSFTASTVLLLLSLA